jgi:hypothetical protein
LFGFFDRVAPVDSLSADCPTSPAQKQGAHALADKLVIIGDQNPHETHFNKLTNLSESWG